MKDRRGFTLIELIAVVAIMIIIGTIAISSISSAIERNKKKQDDTKKSVIVSTAENFYFTHRNTLARSGCIKVDDLVSSGALSSEEAKNANDEIFSGGVKYENGKNFQYVDICNQ